MHPLAAARFLNNLGFRFQRVKVEMTGGHHKKMNRDVVESVGEWLQNLPSLKERFGDKYNAIHTYLIKTPGEANKFLRYLEVLVAWVNANPQVLNEEESFDAAFKRTGIFCNHQPSYNMYDYIPRPVHPLRQRTISLCDGLIRLKASTENDLSGFNAPTIISNIYKVPEMSMPFNPAMLISSNPRVLQGMMYGGSHEFERSLQNIKDSYGHKVYDSIFKNLKSMMEGMSHSNNEGVKQYKIKLKEKSDRAIKDKLEKLEAAEKQVVKAIEDIINDKKLYVASHGHLDLRQVERKDAAGKDDADALKKARKEVLKKHADLLTLSSAYNRRSIEMNNTLQAIATLFLEKLEASGAKAPADANNNYLSKRIGGIAYGNGTHAPAGGIAF